MCVRYDRVKSVMMNTKLSIGIPPSPTKSQIVSPRSTYCNIRRRKIIKTYSFVCKTKKRKKTLHSYACGGKCTAALNVICARRERFSVAYFRGCRSLVFIACARHMRFIA